MTLFLGGLMRLPHETNYPTPSSCIMASNHFHVYGVDSYVGPFYNFGHPVSFSSAWRYQAGAMKIEGWNRTEVYLDVDHITEILQTVAQGTTEHAIEFVPSEMMIRFSVADMNPVGK